MNNTAIARRGVAVFGFLGNKKKEFVMDVKKGVLRRFSVPVLSLCFLIVLPIGAANATSSIANRVSGFCSPNPTSPNVGSCSACHSSGSPSRNDLTAAGVQAQSGNDAFFCPASTPAPTPTPTPAPTPTPTPTPTPSGMTGMSGSSGMSGMGRSSRSGSFRSFRSFLRSGSFGGSRSRSGDDDDGDEREGGDDD
jgi:hypothetical protein